MSLHYLVKYKYPKFTQAAITTIWHIMRAKTEDNVALIGTKSTKSAVTSKKKVVRVKRFPRTRMTLTMSVDVSNGLGLIFINPRVKANEISHCDMLLASR